MPLPDDATLFVPYTVHVIPNSEPLQWVAVQVGDKGELLYASPINWPTQAEAERHAHDLNWLREKALESMQTTNLWVSIDIVSDGPDAVLVFEQLLSTDNRVVGWRLLNPGTDGDNDAWESARRSVLDAIESIAQEDLPFENDESLEDHLHRHGVVLAVDEELDTAGWTRSHRLIHERGECADHTHEWNDEEVDDDASDEEEGAHEDASS